MITVNDLLDENLISEALAYLMTKRNTCGSDGVFLHDLPDVIKNGNIFSSVKNIAAKC